MKKNKFAFSEMRHRVLIEKPTLVSDGQGGTTVSWVEHATVWAKIEPVKTYERLFAEQLQMQRTHRIYTRYCEGVSTDMRIKRLSDLSRIYQIKAVILPDDRKFYMEIEAVENQAT